MKSNYGNEHYCPISIVRVLGVSFVEEYEESEDNTADRKSAENDGAADNISAHTDAASSGDNSAVRK